MNTKKYMTHMKTVLFIGILSILSACNVDLSNFHEIEGLRVLAVRATPPSVSIGESTTIDALVAHPTEEYISYSWQLCSYTLGSEKVQECPDDSILAIGSDDTFQVTITEEMIERIEPFCSHDETLAAQLPDGADYPYCGDDGFLATIRLVTKTPNGEEIVAIKKLSLTEANAPNKDTNLKIQEILHVPSVANRDTIYSVECVEDESSLDVLIIEDDTHLEEVDFTWFVMNGTYESSSGEGGTDTPQIMKFKPLDTATSVSLFIVIRDERYGVDFLEMTIPVE